MDFESVIKRFFYFKIQDTFFQAQNPKIKTHYVLIYKKQGLTYNVNNINAYKVVK